MVSCGCDNCIGLVYWSERGAWLKTERSGLYYSVFGPSEVRALPLGVAPRTEYPQLTAVFDPSKVRVFVAEGVVLGF